MKIGVDEIKEIVDLLKDAEQFRPIVRTVLDTIRAYGPELEEIPNRISKWIVRNRIESIAEYEKAGFSRQDAITMTLDDATAKRRISEAVKTKKK